MNIKLSGTALVIQLTREHIRIAKMQLGEDSRLLCHATAKTPAGTVEDGAIRDVEALAEVLKSAIAVPEFEGVRRVVFSLCSTQVMAERVSVPVTGGQGLEKILDTNMDMFFPLPVDDYRVIRQKLGTVKTENGVTAAGVQLWAVANELLAAYYELAAACGLSVAAVDYWGNSIAAAAGAGFAAPKAGEAGKDPVTEVYLAAERDMMLMTFVRDGQVRMQRSFLCGRDMESNLSEAMLVLEYYRSVEEWDGPMEAVVCGGLAGERGFVRRVGTALGIPAAIAENEEGPEWCACLGAARSGLDFGNPALGGRRERRIKTDTAWHYLVLSAGAVAALLVIISFAVAGLRWKVELSGLRENEQLLKVQLQQNDESAEAYGAYRAKYDDYAGDYELLTESLRTYSDGLPLVFDELEALMPENSSVEDIEMREESLYLQFACPDKTEAAYLIHALREMEYAEPVYVSDLESGATEVSAAAPKVRAAMYTAAAEDSGRQEALRRLLEEDSVALNRFAELYREDAKRPAGETLLYEAISEAVINGELLGAIYKDDLESLQKAAPELADVLTANNENLAAAERLINSDGMLKARYAECLNGSTAEASALDGGRVEIRDTSVSESVTDGRVHFSVELKYKPGLLEALPERESLAEVGVPEKLEVTP